MLLTTILFYAFSGVTVASALAVISARNPVYSVLWLILCFFNAAGLMVMLGAEFLAMLLVIVYVGAVAVLFLFVVMMLNINITRMKDGFLKYLPLGLLVAVVMLFELVGVMYSSTLDLKPLPMGEAGLVSEPASIAGSLSKPGEGAAQPSPQPSPGGRGSAPVTNTMQLGLVLYTDYIYLFQISGLILLVAMIGAIVLTHRRRNVRRQRIADQVFRDPRESVVLVKVESGKGIG